MKYFIIIFLIFSIRFNINAQNSNKPEMRGVWIATVKNIDYPSNRFLSVEKQKQEFIDMIDKFYDIGINAVFFQVRPAADAFFPSKYEPWSEWCTGKQGKAPEPFYDPLKFMIEECHKRDIEFHAWINPFRAVATIEFADIAENHISNTKPEWFFTYDINKYFDPGIPEVRDYVKNIIVDIVNRYDIDGIHFDDYFYPYPVKGKNNKTLKISDFHTYQKYNSEYKNIADWRRNNMDLFIESVNKGIKEAKPYMVFGVAPSGVWRNKSQDPRGSNTKGLAHYDFLFSDVLKWLENDWIDYVAPQLYWSVENKYADYNTLVKWWSKNTYGKHLYIGHAVYRAKKDAKSSSWRNPDEIQNQIRIARKNPNVSGNIFYKAKDLLNNNLGISDALKNKFYKVRVSTPEMPWLPKIDTSIVADENNISKDTVLTSENLQVPINLSAVKLGNKIVLSWKSEKANLTYKIYKFIGYNFENTDNIDVFKTTKDDFLIIERKRFKLFRKKYKFAVSSINKFGIESKESNIIIIKL